MLNKKLLKSGLITNGSLFLIAMVATAGIQLPGDSSLLKGDSTLQMVRFDADLLQVSGLTELDSVGVPSISLNKQALKYASGYLAKNDESLQKIRDKSPYYFRIMDSVFSKMDLPVQLKYLAVVESELKTTALSRVGAVGAWQLMPETARNYSLKVSSRYDERKHLYKSTVAAAKYLNYLHNIFNDWLLTIAAYNGGPGTVFKAIKKSGSRNFWKLQDFLPLETRLHVKRFISTHYFFEGEGSVTTLTKQEKEGYLKKFESFVTAQNALIADRLEAKLAKEQIPVSPENDRVLFVRANTEVRPTEEQEGVKPVIE